MSPEVTLAPNPFGAEHLEDPYPLLASLRERSAIQRAEHPGGVESWLVLGNDEARAALKDARLSTDPRHAPDLFRRAGLLLGDAGEPASLLTSDPPDHTRLRKLVAGAFTPRRAELRRAAIEQVVGGLLDEIAPRGHADLVADFAFPLPIIVITGLLGVPTEDREAFRRWTHEMQTPAGAPDAPARKRAGQQAMHEYLRALIGQRRALPAAGTPSADDDFGTALIHAADERAVSEGELVALFFELLIGGYETVANFLANAIHALLTHPEQRAYLQQHPERMAQAVEELLRFDGSVLRAVPRVAIDDVELAGTRIPKGSLVTIVLGAGNRDPRAFERPAALDLSRPASRHLSFGHGIHFCPGAGLARVEAEIGLSRLLLRLPDLAIDGEPRHRAAGVMRAFEALPVCFTSTPAVTPPKETP
jgi:cytochrome P450